MLMAGTILAGLPVAGMAQDAPADPEATQPPAPAAAQTAAPAATQQGEIVQTISVAGAQRLEAQTILSYIRLRPGEEWSQVVGDEVLKDIYATELFATADVRFENGNVLITVVENPVINRIILEGNDRIKNDKIVPEIRLAPRQIFTRSKVRADVARIIELYKRQGRFAATVEPQMVQLAQNRVDVVFEIDEGPKSKVQQINIIGNEAFSDGDLRGEMITKQARLLSILSSNTSYDPDRLAFDQQKLRQFYLTQGYADFRVVSAVAELTPDQRDFIITYVVEEGERYKFGEVKVESELRDFDSASMTGRLPMQRGDWYNAEQVENTVEQLTDLAGTFGYAFADVAPQFNRSKEDLTMDVTFLLREAPRVYVERIDVNGNTLTQDKVVRREFRVAEGDAFNSLQVKRSAARINSLGFFQENFEITQVEGSAPDRIILEANVEEQATGELQLSAGFSSLESFILQGSIRQRNFRGRGQTVGLSLNYSRFSRSAQASFSEPYLFDRNISAGVDVYRKDYSNFGFNRNRNSTFEQSTTGFSLRAGVPLSEYSSLFASYTLNNDNVSIDEGRFFSDTDGDGIATCDPFLATRFLCDAIGERTSSILGLTFSIDSTDSRLRPTRGRNLSITTEYAGLGGSVKYLRVRGKAGQYYPLPAGFILALTAEGGAIRSFEDRGIPGTDDVRLTDRFFLGEPQIRGFDIRGVGPRVLRRPIIDPDGDGIGEVVTDRDSIQDDALGGTAYYMGRAEIEIPLGTGARELGLRPSVFLDVGGLFNITNPILLQNPLGGEFFNPQRDANGNPIFFKPGANGELSTTVAIPEGDPIPEGFLAQGNTIPAFEEVFLGDSPSPRISVGIGVNWNSPFGPFRIDLAHVLKKQPGDDTKLFSFNVGTQF
ncbi:outer membrane protein assembly factor BamA [Erythrobacter sp. QSSC1-22B]|uniref:outer membrane protein assembly factor BamA n=1 Tax=Erythrobacter sp. QSSC1-22B TaxID=1860125 RepID=UPI0008055BDA|nr:outer membrane protein assembly factor BamA [Erythrobacter sp. QSSC1-22B]OBX18241.1 outer membrane protein assembly factor BamA [Erythrobacter sp. QSSC1-22B]